MCLANMDCAVFVSGHDQVEEEKENQVDGARRQVPQSPVSF